MISPEQRTRIRRLFFAEHWKVGTICTELGLHRDAVELALEPQRFANHRRPSSATALEPYRAFIVHTLKQHPRLRATRVFEMIQGRGYTGSVYAVRRYVRQVRPVSRHEAFFRLTVLPGEQGQVDWGSFGKIKVGRSERLLSCFVLVLSWSRATFARFTLDQTLESFVRCHVNAFKRLGGVPRKLLYEYVPRNIFVLLFPIGLCGAACRWPQDPRVLLAKWEHFPSQGIEPREQGCVISPYGFSGECLRKLGHRLACS